MLRLLLRLLLLMPRLHLLHWLLPRLLLLHQMKKRLRPQLLRLLLLHH